MKLSFIRVRLCLLIMLALSLLSCFKWENPVDPEVIIAVPQFSYPAGTYNNPINISFTNSNSAEIRIRYTLDGSTPNSSSQLYFTPILIDTNTTLKAFATADQNVSETVSATYVFQAATPVLTPEAGGFTNAQSVSLSCSTNGAIISYTTDGSEPTSSSSLYSNPILVSVNTTIKAKASKPGWLDSSTALAAYTIDIFFGLVLVEGGTFYNGFSNVSISSFYFDKYELIQAGYQTVMGSNPASGYGEGANYPVYNVSWFNAIEYCNRRSINEGLIPCYSYSTHGTNPDNWPVGWNASDANVSCDWTVNGYRLPTEAEWEFAARGGNLTNNYTYTGSNDINSVAWYYGNSGNTSHTVGSRAANELSIFDMSGNVYEWCWDNYGTYPSGSQNNPHGAASGSYRVVRGGNWDSNTYSCTVYNRDYNPAIYANYDIGFRCVRVSP